MPITPEVVAPRRDDDELLRLMLPGYQKGDPIQLPHFKEIFKRREAIRHFFEGVREIGSFSAADISDSNTRTHEELVESLYQDLRQHMQTPIVGVLIGDRVVSISKQSFRGIPRGTRTAVLDLEQLDRCGGLITGVLKRYKTDIEVADWVPFITAV